MDRIELGEKNIFELAVLVYGGDENIVQGFLTRDVSEIVKIFIWQKFGYFIPHKSYDNYKSILGTPNLF